MCILKELFPSDIGRGLGKFEEYLYSLEESLCFSRRKLEDYCPNVSRFLIVCECTNGIVRVSRWLPSLVIKLLINSLLFLLGVRSRLFPFSGP